MHTEFITGLDCMQLLTCLQVMVAFNASKLQPLCTQAEQSMYTEDLVIQ